MKRFVLALALVVLTTRAFCWSKQMEFDCGELGPGASQSYLQNFSVGNKFVARLAVAVEASNAGTAEVPKCRVKWTVSATSAGRSRLLFRYADEPEHNLNGVTFQGTSPDGSKLLLDFFTSAGERTGHRPVVYDLVSGQWQIRDVGDAVTRNLPACNYFTMLSGVTNQGDVVLYVPKSLAIDAGCPDQGEWLLNMKTGTVARLEAHAPPQTQPPR
jgi:hypothetical protein